MIREQFRNRSVVIRDLACARGSGSREQGEEQGEVGHLALPTTDARRAAMR